DPAGADHDFFDILLVLFHRKTRWHQESEEFHSPAIFRIVFQELFEGLETPDYVLAGLNAIYPNNSIVPAARAEPLAMLSHLYRFSKLDQRADVNRYGIYPDLHCVAVVGHRRSADVDSGAGQELGARAEKVAGIQRGLKSQDVAAAQAAEDALSEFGG